MPVHPTHLDNITARIIIGQGPVALLLYVHGKHLRSCRDGQLT